MLPGAPQWSSSNLEAPSPWYPAFPCSVLGSICPQRPQHCRCSSRTSSFLKPGAERHQFWEQLLALKMVLNLVISKVEIDINFLSLSCLPVVLLWLSFIFSNLIPCHHHLSTLTHPSIPGILLSEHLHSCSWSLPFGTLPFAPWPSHRKGKCEVLLVLEGHPRLSPGEIGSERQNEGFGAQMGEGFTQGPPEITNGFV